MAEAGIRSVPRTPSGDVADVLVVGGGINGAGIARDLSGRGLKVVLCDKDDLAAHTSSSSTKLVHGGLRYLEYYEFSLVRKSLLERESLLKSAPHIIRPLRFVMPHDPSMRPAWMIRIGLFLYDHLARREVLPGSEILSLRSHEAGKPLKDRFSIGFAYSDGWVDDARLVVLTALDAAERGALVLPRNRCVRACRDGAFWQATLADGSGGERNVRARALVNAAGPWAEQFLRVGVGEQVGKSLRLVKGSHVVVPKLFDHSLAYIFQNDDKRIIFAIPYEHDFTLLGTTEVEFRGSVDAVAIDGEEIAYLCEQASRYFRRPVRASDVVWSYSGVRPLIDDDSSSAAAVTRDYSLALSGEAAPLLTIWGGKITTYRKLAEEAGDMLCRALGSDARPWTEGVALPGGDLGTHIGQLRRPDIDFSRFVEVLARRYDWLPSALVTRIAHAYGSRALRLLGSATRASDLGDEVAPGLFEAELRYLVAVEWARSGEDVLWRRSKLGLHLSAEQRGKVDRWMQLNAAMATAGGGAHATQS